MHTSTQQIQLAKRRVCAWMIDGAIIVALGALLSGFGWALGVLYWLGRDGLFKGQSLGKRCVGVKVLTEQHQQCTLWTSALRNMLWIIPVANVVMGLVGLHCLMHDNQAKHWADRLAGTQVALGG